MNTQRLARGTDEKKWQDSLLLFPQTFHPVPRQFTFTGNRPYIALTRRALRLLPRGRGCDCRALCPCPFTGSSASRGLVQRLACMSAFVAQGQTPLCAPPDTLLHQPLLSPASPRPVATDATHLFLSAYNKVDAHPAPGSMQGTIIGHGKAFALPLHATCVCSAADSRVCAQTSAAFGRKRRQ